MESTKEQNKAEEADRKFSIGCGEGEVQFGIEGTRKAWRGMFEERLEKN